MQQEWFSSWFDTPYYHTLYKHRDDKEAALFLDNISHYLKLEYQAKCWDLCCGRGRHSNYLHKKGFQVIGTDLSEQSINYAKQHHQSVGLEFYQHDMRKLFRINYFDVVFNLFTSFGYFEKTYDDEQVFNAVKKALKPNGYFVFDYLNANYVQQLFKPSDLKLIDGIEFKINKMIENNTVIKQIDFVDNGKTYHFEERVKLFDTSYFDDLASKANLSIKYVFGDYHLTTFNPEKSPRLILIMQKI